jgi:tetratricopeptide (TPR) repeat protein
MKKKNIYLLIAVLLIGISSCKKDLNLTNPDQPTTTVFWKNAGDAQKGVNAIYSTMHRGGLSRWYFFLTMVRADEGYSASPDNNIQNNFDRFLVTDYNYGNITGIWTDNYIGIQRCNQVLQYVATISMDETLKQRYLAEAKFFRGLFYYNLATLWGNVPLQLSISTPTDLPPTSTREQVWAQVTKDLTEAATALPLNYTDPTDLGRATKGSANALLAKAYMQQRKFTEALQPLNAVIQSNVYSLVNNYQDNFTAVTENNAESVFEVQYALNPSDNHDDDTDPRTDNLNYGTSIPPFFAPSPIGFSDGQARRWVTREMATENTASGIRDPRLAVTFLYDSTDVRGPNFSLVYGQTFTSRYGTGNSNVYFRKFLNDATGTGDSFHSPNNYRMIRYADVLLMYAECLNETGNTAGAYQYVDLVRQRAGLQRLSVAKPGLSKAAFLTQLKHERITELSGEGHRWDDLFRWGDLSPALATRDAGFANFVVGKHELLPIPQQDLDINPNLKQNPGY